MADRAVSGSAILTVAIQAGAHLHGLPWNDHIHICHVLVTLGANLSYFKLALRRVALREIADMGFVDKTNVVRETMHTLPVDRGIISESLSYLSYFGLLTVGSSQDLLVAEHTLLHRWHRRRLPLGYVAMTELAGDALLSHVHSMRKGYGLRRSVTEPEWGIGKPGDNHDRQNE